MELSFVTPHKSINDFDPIEINDFSVITGLNGAGKTHLLQAIESGAVNVEGIDKTEIIYYNYNEFNVHYLQDGSQAHQQNDNSSKQRYSQKGSALSQRLNQERNKIINAFEVFTPDLSHIVRSLEPYGFDAMNLLWTEEEVQEYQEVIGAEGFRDDPWPLINGLTSNKLRSALTAIMRFIGFAFFNIDITNLQRQLPRYRALKLLRYLSYDPNIIDWSPTDLKIYNSLIKENRLHIFDDPTELHSPNLVRLYLAYRDALDGTTPTPEDLVSAKKDVELVLNDLEEHLEKNLSADLKRLLRDSTKPYSLLQPITPGSGFLDLTEIANEERSYQALRNENRINRLLHFDGEDVNFLEDEAFLEKNGKSPVERLNEALAQYDCNGYELRCPELPKGYGVDPNNYNLNIGLYNKKKKYPTTLDSLSSGEKTLLALTLYIYKLKYRRKVVSSLLLLDEIDSALHPSMCKRMIDVLFGLFYKDLGIRIIISTHSPSTVAFSPDDSLYIMKSDGHERLMKSTKDAALKELTFGVPSFSINYENRRQVFVESKYDVDFYESFYRIFKKHLNPDVSLNFIASGDVQKNGNGQPMSSCDQVTKITSLLRDSGNKFVWGIIDWDLRENAPACKFVKVLGWQRRYSIESYIFDPLLVGVLLLLEKTRQSVNFGLPNEYKAYNTLNLECSELQAIIDAVVGSLKIDKNLLTEKVLYTIVGGVRLELPKYIAEYQGHNLEERYIEAFPELSGIKRNKEDRLKKQIIDRVFGDFEVLVPEEILEILKSVQEV